jgi:hypothetical protein
MAVIDDVMRMMGKAVTSVARNAIDNNPGMRTQYDAGMAKKAMGNSGNGLPNSPNIAVGVAKEASHIIGKLGKKLGSS